MGKAARVKTKAQETPLEIEQGFTARLEEIAKEKKRRKTKAFSVFSRKVKKVERWHKETREATERDHRKGLGDLKGELGEAIKALKRKYQSRADRLKNEQEKEIVGLRSEKTQRLKPIGVDLETAKADAEEYEAEAIKQAEQDKQKAYSEIESATD
jgi:hypothetical protein